MAGVRCVQVRGYMLSLGSRYGSRARLWVSVPVSHSIPGLTYAPVTQSSEWLKLQATQDAAMTAPTNYSYRNRQSNTKAKREDRWARHASGAPHVHAARGRNTRKNTCTDKYTVSIAHCQIAVVCVHEHVGFAIVCNNFIHARLAG